MINRTDNIFCRFLIYVLLLACFSYVSAEDKRGKWNIRVMEYNVENLFDCKHDTLKDDFEFLPDGNYQWTPSKYWRKLNAVARGIVLASSENGTFLPPDLIGLCEVENDSVLYSLTHRSLLRGADYEYVMTNSPDQRGVDVALMYQPVSFRLLNHYSIRVDTIPGMRPTRDILYVKGEVRSSVKGAETQENTDVNTSDSHADATFNLVPLHVFVVHAPSRRGGERETNPYRKLVIDRLLQSVDSVKKSENDARIVLMGDFNDYDRGPSLRQLASASFVDVTTKSYLKANKKVKGTYCYQGKWGSLDHILLSETMLYTFNTSFIGADPLLLEDDRKYGGVKPYRFFLGPTVHGGFSDHLPLVVDLCF